MINKLVQSIKEWLIKGQRRLEQRIINEYLVRESYRQMLDRQEREVAAFQSRCKHEESFDYYPVVMCKKCMKPLRLFTALDLEVKLQQNAATFSTLAKQVNEARPGETPVFFRQEAKALTCKDCEEFEKELEEEQKYTGVQGRLL